MKHNRLDWENRSVFDLTQNDVDLTVLENVPCSQVEIWNFLDTYSFSIDELIKIIKKEFGQFTDEKIIPNFMIDGIKETNTCMVYFETEVGKMGGKVTDWTIDDDGLPLTKSKRRGIINENYEIEPFFEYYGGIDETQSPRLGK